MDQRTKNLPTFSGFKSFGFTFGLFDLGLGGYFNGSFWLCLMSKLTLLITFSKLFFEHKDGPDQGPRSKCLTWVDILKAHIIQCLM